MSLAPTTAPPPPPPPPSLAELVEQYMRCKVAYYNTSETLVSDAAFDTLEARIRAMAPQHVCLQQIGAPPQGRTIPLPCWMSSLDKFYPKDTHTLTAWLARACKVGEIPALASAKLDGVSGLLVLDGTRPTSLYSRGDGRTGSDWTSRLPLLANAAAFCLPNGYSRLVVRGELIVSKSDFQAYGKGYSTARAMVNGLMGASRHCKSDLLRYIHFVAYAIYEPEGMPLSDQWSLLQQTGMDTVHTVKGASAISFMLSAVNVKLIQQQCEERFSLWRQHGEYEMDGVVVHCCAQEAPSARCTSGNPADAFAYKVKCEEQEGTTTVQHVEWSVSKDGFLKPTIVVEPFVVQGVTIKKTTGFHAKYIQDNAIGPGAQVRISRRGDVIPVVDEVLAPSTTGDAQLPTVPFEWNASGVDIVLAGDACETDAECMAKRLALSFRTMGVKNASVSVARRLIDATVCTDFLTAVSLTAEQLVALDGFAQVSAHKLVESIQHGARNATPVQWIAAGHVFGRSIGPKRLAQIVERIPLSADVANANNTPDRALLMALDGFDAITVDKIIAKLPRVREYWAQVNQLLGESTPTQQLVVKKTTLKNVTTSSAKKVLITGFRCPELLTYIQNAGGQAVSNWSTSVAVVIQRDESYTNRKIADAIANNTPRITRAQWKVDLPSYLSNN